MNNAALIFEVDESLSAYIEIITICIPSRERNTEESIATKSIPNAFILVAVGHLQALRITEGPRITDPPGAIDHLSTYSKDKHEHCMYRKHEYGRTVREVTSQSTSQSVHLNENACTVL